MCYVLCYRYLKGLNCTYTKGIVEISCKLICAKLSTFLCSIEAENIHNNRYYIMHTVYINILYILRVVCAQCRKSIGRIRFVCVFFRLQTHIFTCTNTTTLWTLEDILIILYQSKEPECEECACQCTIWYANSFWWFIWSRLNNQLRAQETRLNFT